MPDVVAEVRRRLAEVADPARAPQMQAYMKSSMPFRGVGMPALRRVLREVFAQCRLAHRDAWQAAVLELWDGARFREERYAAVELTGHRFYRGWQDPEALGLYRHLVVTGAWWDYVDGVASGRVGPILRACPEVVEPVVRRWAVDEDLWVRRTALLCQLGSKADTRIDLLEHAMSHNLRGSRHGGEYFIQKAVGWALREHAKTDPGWVRDVVDRHRDDLAPLSRREALKNL
jgi:3-methyladenine DNA glycosylase AlkD